MMPMPVLSAYIGLPRAPNLNLRRAVDEGAVAVPPRGFGAGRTRLRA